MNWIEIAVFVWPAVGVGVALGSYAESIERDGFAFKSWDLMFLIPALIFVWPVAIVVVICGKIDYWNRLRRERRIEAERVRDYQGYRVRYLNKVRQEEGPW